MSCLEQIDRYRIPTFLLDIKYLAQYIYSPFIKTKLIDIVLYKHRIAMQPDANCVSAKYVSLYRSVRYKWGELINILTSITL